MSTNTILCSTSGSVICLAGWLQSERDGPAVAVAESVRMLVLLPPEVVSYTQPLYYTGLAIMRMCAI